MLSYQKFKSLSPLAILLLTTLILSSLSLNVILKQPSTQSTSQKRCFTSTVYKEERLLIELEVPILKSGLQVMLEVGLVNSKQKSEKKIVLNETIKEAKYKKTVEKDSHNVQDLDNDHSLEYETCIYLKSTSLVSTDPNTDLETFLPGFIFGEQQIKKNAQSYLLSIKLLKNFSHVLEEKRLETSPKPTTHTYTKEHLKLLQERSNKLLVIAKEQVKFHRENEKTEMKTEKHVKDLESSIYSMSITQSALLVFGSLMHINLMRSYLKGSKLI